MGNFIVPNYLSALSMCHLDTYHFYTRWWTILRTSSKTFPKNNVANDYSITRVNTWRYIWSEFYIMDMHNWTTPQLDLIKFGRAVLLQDWKHHILKKPLLNSSSGVGPQTPSVFENHFHKFQLVSFFRVNASNSTVLSRVVIELQYPELGEADIKTKIVVTKLI